MRALEFINMGRSSKRKRKAEQPESINSIYEGCMCILNAPSKIQKCYTFLASLKFLFPNKNSNFQVWHNGVENRLLRRQAG